MPFTVATFAQKLRELRSSFGSSLELVAESTGIDVKRLNLLEKGFSAPSGDEVLIFADHFGCDLTWLIEDEAKSNEENLQMLFRNEGDKLSIKDRYAIKEFLELCKNQALLDDLLQIERPKFSFQWTPYGTFYKGQGQSCAAELRKRSGLAPHALVPDIFHWLRNIGIRVFRRYLPDSTISGLFVDHPEAGRCILINMREDLYRQRFSAAHEGGHAIMDSDISFNVSEADDQTSQLGRELRANSFASDFLIPPDLLRTIGSPGDWTNPAKLIEVADTLWVSVPALLSALLRSKLIDARQRDELRGMNLRLPTKREVELVGDLAPFERARKLELLRRGLHTAYVNQCFDAYTNELITRGKLAEMLLVSVVELPEIAHLFGSTLRHG